MYACMFTGVIKSNIQIDFNLNISKFEALIQNANRN